KNQHQEHHAEHDHSGHSGHSGHDHSGHHGGHEHHHHGNFKELFLKSLPLGIIIMLLSPMAGFDLPFQFTFPYSDIVVAILSTILIIYGGRPFYQG
ncbi:heavy metal translocating P-type ATPase, partial [Streptococcus suis]|nr:heavy metal translocating P-type ATPase [Streptococcus suis]